MHWYAKQCFSHRRILQWDVKPYSFILKQPAVGLQRLCLLHVAYNKRPGLMFNLQLPRHCENTS